MRLTGIHFKYEERDAISARVGRYKNPSDPRRLRALIDLAVSYWRSGEFEEALIVIDRVLDDENDPVIHFDAMTAKAVMLSKNGEQQSALSVLNQLDPNDFPPELKGRFYGQRGMTLADVGEYDRALIDNAGAYQWFVDSGNVINAAAVKNNLARIYRDLHRYKESHNAVDEAIQVFAEENRLDYLSYALDQKAKTFLAEGKLAEARKLVERSVFILEELDQPSCLAESLITYGKILARQGQHLEARKHLERAGEMCELNGHREMAGLAYLTIIEEVPYLAYEKAALYSDSLRVFKARFNLNKTLTPKATSVEIDLALKRSDSNYTQAAHLLGISHQALVKLAERRGVKLKPKRRRRKTVFPK